MVAARQRHQPLGLRSVSSHTTVAAGLLQSVNQRSGAGRSGRKSRSCLMFIDVHILQTVPFSNLNRDDNGTPKTVVYGGALQPGFPASPGSGRLGCRSRRSSPSGATYGPVTQTSVCPRSSRPTASRLREPSRSPLASSGSSGPRRRRTWSACSASKN